MKKLIRWGADYPATFIGLCFAALAWSMVLWVNLAAPKSAHAQALSGAKREIWTCSLDNIAATLTRCKDNPDSQKALFITDIITQSTTTTGGQFGLQYGNNGTANCGASATALFPSSTTTARLASPANTSPAGVIQLLTPIRVPPGKDLCLLGVATNTTTAQINGYIE